jgi:hypothetical protein
MLRHFVAICVLLFLVSLPAHATTITFTVPPANIGPLFSGNSIELSSSSLNGTALAGQSLSLDAMFANNILARLTMTTPDVLGVGLIFSTNAGTTPGFAGPTTTGFLRDANGNPFGGTQTAGRSASSDGSFSIDLNDFIGPSTIVDLSGLHFDTSFPTSGFVVTNTTLQFTLNNQNSVRFGTIQQLPEPTSLSLLAVGFAGIICAARRRANLSKNS